MESYPEKSASLFFLLFPGVVYYQTTIFIIFGVVYYRTTIRVRCIFNINFIANIVIVGLVHLKLNS